MTAKELIAELSRMPPDVKVAIAGSASLEGNYVEVCGVAVRRDMVEDDEEKGWFYPPETAREKALPPAVFLELKTVNLY